MDNKLLAALDTLVAALIESGEYTAYAQARACAFESPHIKMLYSRYRQLQLLVQANAINGKQDVAHEEELRHIIELLHFDEQASAFLLAEYSLNGLMQELYTRLAQAAGADIPFLDT